jgi:hypothetical protein
VEEAARERAGGAAPAGAIPPAVAGGVRRGGGTAPRLLRALRIQALTESTTKRAVLGGIPWALPDDSLIFFLYLFSFFATSESVWLSISATASCKYLPFHF